jgi:YVTN family beta-propeller protein
MLLPITAALFVFSGCISDSIPQTAQADPKSGYPEAVSIILNNKCSNIGCHTVQAKEAVGGLAMETWNDLFEGGSGGAVAIPFRPDQSWLLFYTNTDSAKGVILNPTMPYGEPPLTSAEWETLHNWIAAGAPDQNGHIAFADDPDRKKFYVGNLGCGLVSVFDADSKLCMRYIDAGETPGAGNVLSQVKVSPDRQYWYALIANGTEIRKFEAAGDRYVGSVKIGSGNWSTITITADGERAFVADYSHFGKVTLVNLENLDIIQSFYDLAFPHGGWINEAGTLFYLTAQSGNFIYKFDVTETGFSLQKEVVVNPPATPNTIQNTFDPHEVMLSPDEGKYFVTCRASNEVRVFDAATDSLVKVISVSEYPLDLAISKKQNLLFVTCGLQPCSQLLCKGAVDIIDLHSLEVIKVLQENLYAPHAIAVMDGEGYAIVASRNTDEGGPEPHHSSQCGGRNGYLQLIDLNTLEFISGYRTEVSVDPYSLAVKE